jgi:uncharacterized membrane protein
MDAARAPTSHDMEVVRRFLAYGFLGWALEVAFTGVTDSFGLRDRRLRGHSYLWMLPVYGAGGLLLERLHDRLAARRVPRWARSLVYTAGIYGLEFGSASLLERTTGHVPWRYLTGMHLRGYVRLDYAPLWYGCGWLFEALERELRKLDRPARQSWRPSGRGEGGAGAPRQMRPPNPSVALP